MSSAHEDDGRDSVSSSETRSGWRPLINPNMKRGDSIRLMPLTVMQSQGPNKTDLTHQLGRDTRGDNNVSHPLCYSPSVLRFRARLLAGILDKGEGSRY